MHASERDCEVSFQFNRTRSAVEQGVDGHDAVPPAGTQTVEVCLHVQTTPDVSEARGDAASDSHTAVLGSVDKNDLVVAACRIKDLPLAVLDRICHRKQTLG